jgi:threonine/homoserine/homoserine lactone efflux protein
MVAKHSLAGGRSNGLATAWAHASGIALYALITLVGLAALLHQFPFVFRLITYAGALYLAYLGFNALRSKGGIAARLEAGERMSVWQSAREGFFISLTSPKIMLFFIALFSQFIGASSEASSKAIIVVTPWLVDGLWYTLITFVLSSSLFLEKLRAQAKWIDRLSGLLLMALALKVFIGF